MRKSSAKLVGVGLRHEHYFDAIKETANIDFVEVHAENFFSAGGAPLHILERASERYNISVHATSLGLGSVSPPSLDILHKLHVLCERFNPFLLSDHACFNRAQVHGKQIHTGDLLPLRFNRASLDILCRHVDLVQTQLNRTILLENLSSYIPHCDQQLGEFEFLAALSNKTGCKLLLDVNNLLVNVHNKQVLDKTKSSLDDTLDCILTSLQTLLPSMIGEYHLAGTTPAKINELMIDDHAQTVSDTCWLLYTNIMKHFGVHPTLIEWDQNLPSWKDLVSLATKAKSIQKSVEKSI